MNSWSMKISVLFVVVLGKSRLGKALTLEHSNQDRVAVPDDLARWVGQQGVTESTLRPSGSAFFGEERLTVMTDGQFLEKKTPVRVVRVEEGRIIVEPIEEESTNH